MAETRKRNTDGTFQTMHGGAKTKPYKVWCAMKERCYNPHNKRFANYGARGIKVCQEWQSYPVFKEWYEKNYFSGGTIDRINCNGDYEPSNCRIVTTRDQNRNYSRNHFVTYNGETLCLSDMAEKYGVNRATVLFRIKRGLPMEEVFNKTDRRTKK